MRDHSVEYPYDPREKFSSDELTAALDLRSSVEGKRRPGGVIDQCPHTPACPTVDVCIEEIAWYLRHKTQLDRDDEERS